MVSSSPNTPGRTLRITVILCRIIVGVTFLFSGFVKGIDPVGVAIKLKEYFAVLGIELLTPSSPLGSEFVTIFVNVLAIGLSLYEFVLGAAILFGIYRKLAPTLAFLTMCFMTPLTLYLAIANPVQDCGCFGEALVLSNWQTFYKNLVLFAAALFLLLYNHKEKSLFVKPIRWIPSLFSMLYILTISVISYMYQPLLDFRPYKSGLNLREAMERDEPQPEYLFIYEKNGVEQEFSIDNAPMSDTTWHFVDRIERMPKGEKQPETLDFLIRHNDSDITSDILSDENYTFLLLVPSVKGYDNSWDDKILNLYDYAYEHSYNFYVLTSDVYGFTTHLEDKGISLPCYQMDETVIETIARGNPAIAMIKDGILYWKISPRELIDMAQYVDDIQATPLSKIYEYNAPRKYSVVLILYIFPLLFLYLCEQAVVLLVEKVRTKRLTAKQTGKQASKQNRQEKSCSDEENKNI